MQPDPTAAPAIDSQQHQYREQLMMMPLPPQGAFWPQQPQPQLAVQQFPQQVSSGDEIRTLWIGGLQHWMDENYVHECFASTQDLLSVKIIRNKQTGLSEGYGFMEFASNVAAQMVLQNYNGLQMPMAEQFYRLNWATNTGAENRSEDFTIFVGDLASDDTDEQLREIFRAKYLSVKGAKVITDRVTGRSKGYGFVTFGDRNEQDRAITEMDGMLCSSRPMRIGPGITKQTTVYQQPYPPQLVELDAENDPNNTTLFVGGLDPNVTVEMLMETFGQYGQLVHAKIPLGKRCGFVQYSNRASAELALQMLHGIVLGQRPIRLSWGRRSANKQVQHANPFQMQQPDPNQWNGAYYGDGQGYNAGYGYGTQPQQTDSNPPNGVYYGGIQGSNADYSYATQPYNAYATQSQDPNMFISIAPNANYQQHPQ